MELEVKLVWMDIGLTYKTGLHVLLPVEGVLKLFIEDVSPLNLVVKIVKEKKSLLKLVTPNLVNLLPKKFKKTHLFL
jgi:hypothetical protein